MAEQPARKKTGTVPSLLFLIAIGAGTYFLWLNYGDGAGSPPPPGATAPATEGDRFGDPGALVRDGRAGPAGEPSFFDTIEKSASFGASVLSFLAAMISLRTRR